MPQIQISDQLYQERRNPGMRDAGFANVDAHVADVLKLELELEDEVGDLDNFFTPERLAQIDEAEAAIARESSPALRRGRHRTRKAEG